MKRFFKQKNNGFTRLVDFGDVISSRAKGASPKLTTGFTLIETLVAISIFTASVLGLMSVLSQGVSDTNYAKKKIIAGYLAQEGIEYITNLRDTFVLYDSVDSLTGWNSFKTYLSKPASTCDAVNGCYINDNLNYNGHTQVMIGLPLIACPGSCPLMSYDNTTGKYGYASGANSGFSRKIFVTPITGTTDEIKISSVVSWTQGSGTYSITFSKNLFNWVE